MEESAGLSRCFFDFYLRTMCAGGTGQIAIAYSEQTISGSRKPDPSFPNLFWPCFFNETDDSQLTGRCPLGDDVA